MSAGVTDNMMPPFLRDSGKVIYSDRNTHGSLYWLTFCHYCKELRDQKSLSYEIDVKRCIVCSETFNTSETSEREAGCPQCFECPICAQTLVVRTGYVSSAAVPEDGEDKSVTEKRYHLVCQTCRWTSRGAGIPDATRPISVATPWKFKPEGASDPRDEISVLAEYYQGLSLHEKAPLFKKDKGKYRRPRVGYSSLVADKYKLVSVAQKRLSGLDRAAPPNMDLLDARVPKVAFHTSDSLTECADVELFEYASAELAADRLSCRQRLLFSLEQPKSNKNLVPRNKPLSCKKAWRCKSCQHVLVKQDFATHSVKFKMTSSAPLLVPTVRPCNPKLSLGLVTEFVVVISNPLTHDVHMTFSHVAKDEPIPEWIVGILVEDLKLPEGNVVMLSRTCASGTDEKGKEAVTSLPDDDLSVIAFRKYYVVGLKFSCQPMSADEDNWASFNVRYDFQENQPTVYNPMKTTNTETANPSPQTFWIDMRIDMNLGKASS